MTSLRGHHTLMPCHCVTNPDHTIMYVLNNQFNSIMFDIRVNCHIIKFLSNNIV